MQANTPPSKIPVAFANSGTKNPIPTESQISIAPGRASLETGFPPLTMTPLSAGGIPPLGADFNGILNRVTEFQRWQSAGGHFAYDAAFAATVSGYPKGAMLVRADGLGYWLNTIDGNTTNPDAAGANWLPFMPNRMFGGRQELLSSGVLQIPSWVNTIYLSATAPGGAGAGSGNNTGGDAQLGGGGGGGGGAGQWIIRKAYSVTPGASIAVTMGAPGVVGEIASNGGDGGNLIVGSVVTLIGGSGGRAGVSRPAAGAGGSGGPGYPQGSDGSDGVPAGNGGAGASNPFGGGGGASRAATFGGIVGHDAYGFGAGGGGAGSAYGFTVGNGSKGGAAAPGYFLAEW